MSCQRGGLGEHAARDVKRRIKSQRLAKQCFGYRMLFALLRGLRNVSYADGLLLQHAKKLWVLRQACDHPGHYGGRGLMSRQDQQPKVVDQLLHRELLPAFVARVGHRRDQAGAFWGLTTALDKCG